MIKKNNSGITLISLVITIIILLILASIGIVEFQQYVHQNLQNLPQK